MPAREGGGRDAALAAADGRNPIDENVIAHFVPSPEIPIASVLFVQLLQSTIHFMRLLDSAKP
jgi:hypothetical protein